MISLLTRRNGWNAPLQLLAWRRLSTVATTIPHSAPAEQQTFGGHFEQLDKPIAELEKTLTPPFRVIGTRKPGSFRFLSWDPNISLLRDHLNQHLYITFEDAKGTIVGPVCYRADITTWGAKLECGIRYKAGYLMSSAPTYPVLDRIPTHLKVDSGYDGGITIAAFGLTKSHFSFVDSDVPGVSQLYVKYYGCGNALGLTWIFGHLDNSKMSTEYITNEYRRLPFLFKPTWEPKEQAIVFAGMAVYVLLWFFLIGDFVLGLVTGTWGKEDVLLEPSPSELPQDQRPRHPLRPPQNPLAS